VRRLLDDGLSVGVVADMNAGAGRLRRLVRELDVVSPNILSADLSARMVDFRPDWVFHLATYGAYPWQDDLSRATETNITGTARVLDAARRAGFECFVNAGSSSEYGAKDGPAAETDQLEPNSYYAITKAAATLLCSHVARREDVPIVTLRLYSVYGPHEESRRLVPQLLTSALSGSLPPLANPRTARDFVHVDDVCDAFLAAARATNMRRGSVYNVGSGQQTTLAELVRVVDELFGPLPEPRWGSLPDRPWDTSVWVADPSLIRREIGWHAVTDVRSGLIRTAAWLREQLGPAPGAAGRGPLVP